MSITASNGGYPRTSATPCDADTLLRIGDGDPAAWDDIVHRYGELVSATVRSFHLGHADALDAVQMTWLRLAECAHQIQDPQRLGGWLVTIARRTCLTIWRHQARFALDPFDTLAETVADPSIGPEQRVIDTDTTRTLWNFVSELSPRRQTVLRALFTDHRRPYDEVAQIANIPLGGIGPTRARALAQLRDRLEQHGLGPGAW
jgi:RNA polymerase sigma factor (sigma-70 family)